MSDTPGSQERPERRLRLRYWAGATALVIRDSDKMRLGIEASLADVSSVGLGLSMTAPLDINEQVKIQLKNDVQKVAKEVRGVVRHATQRDDGTFQVGVELFSRLTPLEVLLLRMGIRDDSQEKGKIWM